jgi:RNA polymerase sigma-70 factor (ECF subfamily)
LEKSGTKDKMPSNYHLEAARSFYHSTAKKFSATDWGNILYLYDVQLRMYYSPMLALNRIIAYEKVNGPEKAMEELRALQQKTDLTHRELYHAIQATLFGQLNRVDDQKKALEKAICLSENTLVQQHYEKKLALIL